MIYAEAKQLRLGDPVKWHTTEVCYGVFESFGYTPRKAWVVDANGSKWLVATKFLERGRKPMSKPEKKSNVDHPAHYHGKDSPFEVVKVFEGWFRDPPPIHTVAVAYLFNTIKYIARAGRKNPATIVEDLKKAHFYLGRAIDFLEGKL